MSGIVSARYPPRHPGGGARAPAQASQPSFWRHLGSREAVIATRPVLLFDALNTLVHDPFYEDVPRFFGLKLAELLPHLHPTAWVEFERGETDEATFLARFFRDGRAYDAEGMRAHMQACYRWLDGMEELLAELRAAGAPMHVLSNYPTWYELIEQRVGVSRYLPWTFVSCKMGVRKPDADAFRIPARELGLRPEQCLLIDDRRVNCEGAEAIGMPAIKFEGASALREALVERGVL